MVFPLLRKSLVQWYQETARYLLWRRSHVIGPWQFFIADSKIICKFRYIVDGDVVSDHFCLVRKIICAFWYEIQFYDSDDTWPTIPNLILTTGPQLRAMSSEQSNTGLGARKLRNYVYNRTVSSIIVKFHCIVKFSYFVQPLFHVKILNSIYNIKGLL